jgi:alkylation response protein AidB-like acyl-CoA dehydrogenase
MSLESAGQSKRMPFRIGSPLLKSQKSSTRLPRLARERFALRAARYGAESIFPAEHYADLRTHRLMDLTVLTAYGGKRH